MKRSLAILWLLLASVSTAHSQQAEPENIIYSNNIILLVGIGGIPDPINTIKQERIQRIKQSITVGESQIEYDQTGALSNANISRIVSLADRRQLINHLSKNADNQWVQRYQLEENLINQTIYQTDERGRIVKASIQTVAEKDPATFDKMVTQTISYDDRDRVISVKTNDHRPYSDRTYQYGENGKIAEIRTCGNVTCDIKLTTRFFYDPQNRLIKMTNLFVRNRDNSESSRSFSDFDQQGNWLSSEFNNVSGDRFIREISYY